MKWGLSVINKFSVLKKIIIRLGIAAVFAAAWYYFFGEGLTAAPPLVFAGFVMLLASWLSYLRSDGFRMFNPKMSGSNTMSKRFKALIDRNEPVQAGNQYKVKEEDDDSDSLDYDSPEDTISIKITLYANIISGALLILVSFIFA